MTNVIKVKFIRNNVPSGRAYTYYTPVEVAVDDIVELESRDGVAKGIVTEVDVPVEEIAVYGDAAKSIIGKAPIEKDEEALKAIEDTYTRCPFCLNLKENGHDYTCKLANALAKAEGK